MTKLLNNSIQQKKSYVNFLESLDWSFFITGSTRYELTLRSTRRLMERWFDAFKVPESRLFWVAEKFEVKDGYHAHGLLYLPNRYGNTLDPEGVTLFNDLIDHWQWATGNKAIAMHGTKIEWDKAKWNALNLKKFNRRGGAGGYCAKYVFKSNADYDLLLG